jgi:hypothetical protein
MTNIHKLKQLKKKAGLDIRAEKAKSWNRRSPRKISQLESKISRLKLEIKRLKGLRDRK